MAGWRAVNINSTSRSDDYFLDDVISEQSILIAPEMEDSGWYGNVPTHAQNYAAVVVVCQGASAT